MTNGGTAACDTVSSGSAKPRPWALITGACSGLGLEMARALARRGYPLIMVSDRRPQLEAASEEIAERYGVAVQTVSMDLARPEAAAELHAEVKRRGASVEILVSNAGFLIFGEVADIDPSRADAILQLHVVTPSLLAGLFSRDMRARQCGHILLVSSASAWADFPGTAHYGSSKRYLRSFAASLRVELRPWGVNVTCLAPGAVATGLYDCANGAAMKAARLGVLSDPARVAETAIRGLLRRRAVVLPGTGAKLMALTSLLTPRWLITLVRERTGYLSRPEASGPSHTTRPAPRRWPFARFLLRPRWPGRSRRSSSCPRCPADDRTR